MSHKVVANFSCIHYFLIMTILGDLFEIQTLNRLDQTVFFIWIQP